MYTSIFGELFPDSIQRTYGEPIKIKVSPSEVAIIILLIEAIAIAVIAIVIFALKMIYYVISLLLWLVMSSLQTAVVIGLTLGVAALVFFFIVGVLVSHFENKTPEIEALESETDSKMTKMVMPSGRKVLFPVPAKQCECKKFCPTKLQRLQADHKSGSEYQVISEEMNKTIRNHRSGSFSKYDIVSIQRVQNCCLWNRFRNRQFDIAKEGSKIDQRMLFHGTSAAEDLVKTGFDERHSNPSGMFGAGIYFAEHSSKSNQYVFGYMGGNGCRGHQERDCLVCERKMLLCRVSLGNVHKLTSANKMSHPPPGHHSVAGVPTSSGQVSLFGLLVGVGGLQYPEYVIYRGEQAYPEYLITYKIVK